MPKANKTLTRRLAMGLLFGFVVLLILALVGDLGKVSDQVLNFRWTLFPLVIALTLFNYLLRFFKWHLYLRQVGSHGVSIPESARLFIAGFPLAITPGKIGEAFKGVWLNQADGTPVARGVSVVAAERISDGLAVLALSTVGVIAFSQYWPLFGIILALLLTVVVISQIRPLALFLINITESIPLINRLTQSTREFYEGSFLLFRPRILLAAVAIGIISWLGEGIGMYVILVGLGVPPGMGVFSIAVFVLSFSIVIGAASALPGGLGASEASIAGMLILLLGLSADVSAAATLLIRLATLWFGVALGLIIWSFSHHLLGFGDQRSNPENPIDQSQHLSNEA
jgi:uncharacterized protein (TIRG00374 family)